LGLGRGRRGITVEIQFGAAVVTVVSTSVVAVVVVVVVVVVGAIVAPSFFNNGLHHLSSGGTTWARDSLIHFEQFRIRNLIYNFICFQFGTQI